MRLTLRLFYWVLLAAAMYAAFSYFRLPVLRLFLIVNLALLLFSLLQTFWNFRMLEMHIRLARTLIPRGQNARWYVYLKNKSRVSTLPLRICSEMRPTEKNTKPFKRYLYGSLERNGEDTAVLIVPGKHCGILRADSLKIKIAVADLCGFFYLHLPASRIDFSTCEAFVLPLAAAHTPSMDESLVFMEGAYKSKRPFDESEELDQLRKLQAGDPLKRIHWKLSARANDWMVKQYCPEDDIYWTMLCDVQTLSEQNPENLGLQEQAMKIRDYALDIAAALIETALLQGNKLELKTYHPGLRMLKGADLSLYPDFLKQLVGLPPQASLRFNEQIRREIQEGKHNPYLLISTSFDNEIFEALQVLIQSKAETFFVLIPLHGKISPEQSQAIDQLCIAGMQATVSYYPDNEQPDAQSVNLATVRSSDKSASEIYKVEHK